MSLMKAILQYGKKPRRAQVQHFTDWKREVQFSGGCLYWKIKLEAIRIQTTVLLYLLQASVYLHEQTKGDAICKILMLIQFIEAQCH